MSFNKVFIWPCLQGDNGTKPFTARKCALQPCYVRNYRAAALFIILITNRPPHYTVEQMSKQQTIPTTFLQI